jgi:transposase
VPAIFHGFIATIFATVLCVPARPISFNPEHRPWPVPTEACQRVRGSVRTLRKDYRLFKAECGVMLQRTQASIDELMAGTLSALQASIGAQQQGS